ncbi:MAG: DUF4166 domain-containing protein [Dokdonella sp.]
MLSLFARLLGDTFAALPPQVRALHSAQGVRRYRGKASVSRGRGVLSRMCGWATRLPPATTSTLVDVEIAADAGGETWTRLFGAHAMRSRMWQHEDLLRERLGWATFGFALSARDGLLRWDVREVRTLGLRLPARWFRGVHASESELDGRYRFEVRAALPLIGDLIHYEGWLAVPQDTGCLGSS